MSDGNPYLHYVSSLAQLVHDGRDFQLGGFAMPAHAPVPADAPTALIFSPHPDDECIIGGLALRLQREAGYRVVNVAVTQGSNKARQQGRWEELAQACQYLGFELEQTVPGGLERVNVKTRDTDPEYWASCVAVIARIVAAHRPAVVFFPHQTDWNSSHIGTHHLLVDALGQQPDGFRCQVVETEFWGAMSTPNLMVESSVAGSGRHDDGPVVPRRRSPPQPVSPARAALDAGQRAPRRRSRRRAGRCGAGLPVCHDLPLAGVA